MTQAAPRAAKGDADLIPLLLEASDSVQALLAEIEAG